VPVISSDEMDRLFREALATLAADAGGCRALDCATWGMAAPIPRLCFDGQEGGYYVHTGLFADAGKPAGRWMTVVSAVWVPEDGERRTPLAVHMEGAGARDGRLLAVLAFTAVLTDRNEHSGQPERVRVYDESGEPHDITARTRTGRVLTDGDIRALADEAGEESWCDQRRCRYPFGAHAPTCCPPER